MPKIDVRQPPNVAADTAVATHAALVNAHACLPWLIDINPMAAAAVSAVTWSTKTVDTAQLGNGYLQASVQNAELNFDVVLAAGTWDIRILSLTNNLSGIYTVQLDGVTVGTIDHYSASVVRNIWGAVNSVAVATSGKKRLKFLMATKNASSTDYRGYLTAIQLQRTT